VPAKLHIQFAAGTLEPDLLERTGASSQPAWTARRDLERYYQLLRDELGRLRLSETEALTVVAACRGWLVEPSSYRHLWVEVEDYLGDQTEDTGIAQLDQIPRLAAGDRAVLVAKLRALSPGAALAVADAVERYWVLASEAHDRAALALPTDTPIALLRTAGLVSSTPPSLSQ
jgi:hypothetical protein